MTRRAREIRSRLLARAAALLLAAGCLAAPAPAQPALPGMPPGCDTIARIEVRGQSRMTSDAVRFDLGVKPGDPWDDQRIRREFARFWKRGYFSDLRFFRRCDPDGAALILELRERPTISAITYDKVKNATEQQIEDFFSEQDFAITVGSPLDRKRLWRAASLIKQLLGQKGYLDARVEAMTAETSASTSSVHFRIRAGNKTRIRELAFSGNDAYKDGVLRRQLELTEEWRWWWPFGRKSLYHPLKYQQDVNNVLKFYRDRGYLDVDVKPPVIDVKTVRGRKAEEQAEKKRVKAARKAEREREKRREELGTLAELTEAPPPPPAPDELDIKEKKWVYIDVPVVEGPVFRLGDVRFEGNTIFEDQSLRGLIPLRKGSVLSDALLEIGLDSIRTLYGDRGYIYAVASRRFERDEAGEPVADVVVTIDEDQPYTIGRIEFSGNTTTQDLVLRRELNVFEGELVSQRQLERSVLKLRQLGFWLPGEEPSLDPDIENAVVDITIVGEEQSRNEVNLGGGFSELEGGFFFGSYSTTNFLGRGETLSVQAAVGGRANRASIQFLERWFLGRPITFGFRLFRTTIDFGRTFGAGGAVNRLSRSGSGASITLGRRLGDFTLLQGTYSFEDTRSDSGFFITDPTTGATRDLGEFKTKLASVTPVFSFRKLNNPLRPTKGLEILLSPQVTAQALGSDHDFLRPRAEISWYQPLGKRRRMFVAVHGEGGWVRPFGPDVSRESGFIDGVPLFQRFFIGGDSIGPRVFETRSLSPTRELVQTDPLGNPIINPGTGQPARLTAFVGGSKYALLQTEIGVPVGRTATIAGFVDVGGVYDNGQDITFEDARVSAGVEFRVFLPVFQAPIRLIYGWPVQEEPGDRTSNFQFSIGLPF